MKTFNIAVLPGDGIGKEIMPITVELLKQVESGTGGYRLCFYDLEAGADLYRRTGEAFPEETFEAASRADAILLGAMGLPQIRYSDGREIAPQLDLRERLQLYAGLRPIKAIPGIPRILADPRAEALDLVIVRESTEGLFSYRNTGEEVDDRIARDTMVITRPVCERLFDFSFQLARRRKAGGKPGIVTCVDKANVLRSFAFFRKIFDERSRRHADIKTAYSYIDAMALRMVASPWDLDVLVMENMFGDIISDLGAALIGGMGMAPSGDIGDSHAVFQPCHGSAPDIAGSGKANPTAMFLSAALMLRWLAECHDVQDAARGADTLQHSVEAAFRAGELIPFELGGQAGTEAIYTAVRRQMDR